MSTTEWVIETYLDGNVTGIVDLEAAKNFVFIWCLFEHKASNTIFSGKGLNTDKFRKWINTTLKIGNELGETVIINSNDNIEIKGNLVNYINDAFEHFYQIYKEDEDEFIKQLYREDISRVKDEKKEFEMFAKQRLDKNNIQHKIYFMFFVSKRMRNNFFHGIKKTYQISQNKEEFIKSGEYLIAIMSLLDK